MKKPDKIFLSQSDNCSASWQVINHNGVTFSTRCRKCGVYVTDGGVPQCLSIEKREHKWSSIDYEIKLYLYKLIEKLGGDSVPLSIIGSWKDSMSDEDTLSMIKHYVENDGEDPLDIEIQR